MTTFKKPIMPGVNKMKRLDCNQRFETKKVGGNTFIQGWANRAVVDRGKDLIKMDAWNINNYKKVPMILFNHDKDKPIGKAVDVRPTDQGLWIKAQLSNSKDPTIAMVRDLVNEGMLNAFSVGFDAQDEQTNPEGVNEIKQAELYEVSIVTLPMNQDSTFDVSTKALAKIGKNKIRTKILQAKGAWVAETVHGKIYDMEKSGAKRSDLLSQIASGAGISSDDLTQVLAGNVTPIPANVLESFAKVLGLDLKKLQKLDAGDAKVDQQPEEQPKPEEPAQKSDEGPEQVAMIGILVPKDQAQDQDAAQSLVSDAGYEPLSVEDKGDSWYVLLEDPADFQDGTSQLDLGNQVVAIVGLRKPLDQQTPEAQEPQPQPEADKRVPPAPADKEPHGNADEQVPPKDDMPPLPTPVSHQHAAPPADVPKPQGEKPAPQADANPPSGEGDKPAAAGDDEDPAKLKEEYQAFLQDQEATVNGKPGNPASWVADEALWEKAKRASEHATGKIDYAFTVWWYLQHGGTKKSNSTERQKAVAPDPNTAPISGGGDGNMPVDDNPYLAQARQTNVLLGSLIKEVQQMCMLMQAQQKVPEKGSEYPMTEEQTNEEMSKSVMDNLREYSEKLELKLRKLGA
jgi:HK97 family phage prohead protease